MHCHYRYLFNPTHTLSIEHRQDGSLNKTHTTHTQYMCLSGFILRNQKLDTVRIGDVQQLLRRGHIRPSLEAKFIDDGEMTLNIMLVLFLGPKDEWRIILALFCMHTRSQRC